MLTTNDIKEELSIAYVRAVASRAGFAVEEIRKDRDSIDLKILARGRLTPAATLTAPELAVQLKATVLAAPCGSSFTFPLPRKNYDDLAEKTLVPRILVVFTMPRDPKTWLRCSHGALTLKQCAYWASLRGLPPTTNRTTKAVTLRRAQPFNPTTLRDLLVRVACQEDLP